MPRKGPGRNKPHRGGGGNPKSNNKTSSIEIPGDNIVFTNSKSDPSTNNRKGNISAEVPQGPNVSNKPTVKQVIGGASWTGKLPVNMLSEHCQKQKWEKPEYSVRRVAEGFTSAVILKAKNPKTKEMMELPPMILPKEHRESAIKQTILEAKHFAATYALFRVRNMTNLHMMLPPAYKDVWKGVFQELKRLDENAGNGWMYAADPFAASLERKEAQTQAFKKYEEQRKEREKREEHRETQNSLALLQHGKAKQEEQGSDSREGLRQIRGWNHAPKVDMGMRMRVAVEELIRGNSVWNSYNQVFDEAERTSTINDFTQLGFKRVHVEEAVSYCRDREESLEWLLVHVPEDDLPSWSFPENYAVGVSIASNDIKREVSLDRLSESGYSRDVCAKIFAQVGENEDQAAEVLQEELCGDGEEYGRDASLQSVRLADEHDAWSEEMSTLEAIFGERFALSSPTKCQIAMAQRDGNLTLLFQRPSQAYPAHVPVMLLRSTHLPAYIRLSIVRQAVKFARTQFLNEPMIFSIVDWLENNLSGIVNDPGRLTEISAVASSAAENQRQNRFGHPNAHEDKREKRRRHQNQNKTQRSHDEDIKRSTQILVDWTAKQANPKQKIMLKGRQSLPAWPLRERIVETVNKYQVTIISGETGSGKSTQSVQFILDDMIRKRLGAIANIVCTQPRRISALGLADRVSEERCGVVGDEVGYAIRGESKSKYGTTKISFVTTGVLLRRLQGSIRDSNDVESALADVTHVVIDEVHERSLDTDFLLILMKEMLEKRPALKLVLMSATMDSDVFVQYFGGRERVGKVEIQGRTFPVQDFYLDDIIARTGFALEKKTASSIFDEEVDDAPSSGSSIPNNGSMVVYAPSLGRTISSMPPGINYALIALAVSHISNLLPSSHGSILIFLPGTLEITRTLGVLSSNASIYALPLHASLPPSEQRVVFRPPPPGKRKVIAATNVAETSITISDVLAVIDTGRVKETSLNPVTNAVTLSEAWASRAACAQRRGRAGRVADGLCFKLYTRHTESFVMSARSDPEIMRVPLEQLCLSVKAMGISSAAHFLSKALTPPPVASIACAVSLLDEMGALENGVITPLGRHMALIPADLRCAKLLIYGCIFRILEPCLTLAAILSVKSPFTSPQKKRDESQAARTKFAGGNNEGDLICDLRAYEMWVSLSKSSPGKVREWCHSHFLSLQTFSAIASTRSYLVSALQSTSLLPLSYSPMTHPTFNMYTSSDDTPLLRALIAGSFNPSLAKILFPTTKYAPTLSGTLSLEPAAREIKYYSANSNRVFLHPSSILFSAQMFPQTTDYVAYFGMVETSKAFIRDVTPFNALGLLLLTGKLTLDIPHRGLVIAGRYPIRAWLRVGVLIQQLRKLVDAMLRRRWENPTATESFETEQKLIEIVERLVRWNGLDG